MGGVVSERVDTCDGDDQGVGWRIEVPSCMKLREMVYDG